KATDIAIQDSNAANIIMSQATVPGVLTLANMKELHEFIDLSDAVVGSFYVDESLRRYDLDLNGLVYARLGVSARLKGKAQKYDSLELLGQQRVYTPQPYDQLAKVLREEGDETAARGVLIAKYDRARSDMPKSLYWLIGGLMRVTVAYGFDPILA